MSLTLREMVGKLESLTRQQLTISQGLDVLEEQAITCNELLIINVMRDAFYETMLEEQLASGA
ncbi:MAG TPA: hypothetical protein DDZ97_14140 [Deltaproteobacteria bacterium]|jgi:hypothetical protein|nr:MAG: hypothetical protein EVA80_06965 [Pseudomonadota bacterium]HBM54234.1 hypothetical protein [Deltaproteobacteria bacterium]|tara:strand:+ start:27525 stop:27713 length:189 start_codon:yes stop_codon:yes gene_type:complete